MVRLEVGKGFGDADSPALYCTWVSLFCDTW